MSASCVDGEGRSFATHCLEIEVKRLSDESPEALSQRHRLGVNLSNATVAGAKCQIDIFERYADLIRNVSRLGLTGFGIDFGLQVATGLKRQ